MKKDRLQNSMTRGGLSVLAYHLVALIIGLALLLNSIDWTAAFVPMIATSQIWAAAIWLSGGWIAPVALDFRYQIHHWWLLGAAGLCHTFMLLLLSLAFHHQPLSSLARDAVTIKFLVGLVLYCGISSVAYVLLLWLFSKSGTHAEIESREGPE
jgi:hypothetical protein